MATEGSRCRCTCLDLAHLPRRHRAQAILPQIRRCADVLHLVGGVYSGRKLGLYANSGEFGMKNPFHARPQLPPRVPALNRSARRLE